MSDKVTLPDSAGPETGSKQLIEAMATTVLGTAINLCGYQGAVAVLALGAWTDGTHTFSLDHSDDNSTFVACTREITATPPVVNSAAADGKVYLIHYNGAKTYVRWSDTVVAGTSGMTAGWGLWKTDPKAVR